MRVTLAYFTPTGTFVQRAFYETSHSHPVDVWGEVGVMRRLGRLPGLRPNSGRDHYVLVEMGGSTVPHLITPPVLDEDDITPVKVSTGEWPPLLRPPEEDEK